MTKLAHRILRCVALLASLGSSGRAHDAFAEFVWHRVELAVQARHLDVTVQLTFFEDWSERERRRMDADGDGRVQRRERETHARTLVDTTSAKVMLTVAGRRVTLIPLYEPEIDLLASDAVGRSHHQLTLRFFATLPAECASGSEITVDDRLWPEARCLGELALAPRARGTLEFVGVSERELSRSGSDALRFTARLTGRSIVGTAGTENAALPLPARVGSESDRKKSAYTARELE